MSNPRTADLTVGSIPHHLFRLSTPMIWGILSIVSMQLADVYFISGLGHTQLEAISFTFPVSMVVFNLVMGLSIATSSICARLIGKKDTDLMKHFMFHALLMATGIGVLLALLGELLIVPVFHKLGAGAEHMPYILSFMRISLWGYVFITVPLVSNAALRASGDTVIPSLIMMSAAVINIPLSYALVYGHFGAPAWGMTGAAVANVTANAITGMIALYVLVVRRKLIDRAAMTLRHIKSSAKQLLMIAVPVGMVNLLTPLSAGVVTALLSKDGADAVAAYGIIARIEGVAAVMLMAVAIGMGPIIGQNFGAKKYDRVYETISLSIRFCIAWSFIVGLSLMALGGHVARAFTDNAQTIYVTQYYFIMMGVTTAFANITSGWSSAFNAMGKPKFGVMVNIIRLVPGLILCAWIGHIIAGWHGMFIGMMLGNLVLGLALHFWSARIFKTLCQV